MFVRHHELLDRSAEGWIRDVRELVALSTLDDDIKNEHVSVRGGLEDEHVLIEGLFDVEDFVDLEGHGLARPLGRDLTEPTICVRYGFPGQITERTGTYP